MERSWAIALAALLSSPVAHSFTPWQGHWLNWNEAGSGYNITVQNGTMMMTIFSYKGNGDSEWYLASGSLTGGGRTFAGTLDVYRNGQCINCSFANGATKVGNDGTIGIEFADETHATLSLPNGRTTNIVPFNFGQGEAPNALLGEWIYTYDISSTWADRYAFNRIVPGTENGDGMVLGSARLAACELQVRGAPEVIGMVVCAQVNLSGALQNGYVYRYGIEQTYDGYRFSPSTSNLYPMKGFLTRWKGGQSKAALVVPPEASALRDSAKEEEELALHGSVSKALAAEIGIQFDNVAARIREARALP